MYNSEQSACDWLLASSKHRAILFASLSPPHHCGVVCSKHKSCSFQYTFKITFVSRQRISFYPILVSLGHSWWSQPDMLYCTWHLFCRMFVPRMHTNFWTFRVKQVAGLGTILLCSDTLNLKSVHIHRKCSCVHYAWMLHRFISWVLAQVFYAY